MTRRASHDRIPFPVPLGGMGIAGAKERRGYEMVVY